MIILGTVAFGSGIFIGFNICTAIISSMVKDENYMKSKIGKEKLERMTKIYYEKRVIE